MIMTAPIDRFNLTYLKWRLNDVPIEFLETIRQHGVLLPVSCIEFNNECYIVDGYQRYQAALKSGIKRLPYVLIEPEVSIAKLVMLIQKDRLLSSTILKIRFISAFDWMIDADHLMLLSLPFYSHIKKDLDRISSLPLKAQYFLHDKGFSLKEIVNLMHYSQDAFHQ